MTLPRRPLLWLYLLGVGALLLGQGAAGLLVRAAGHNPHGATRLLSDPGHSFIHVFWGIALLGALAWHAEERVTEGAALAFGVFYSGLLVLGLVVHHPFGLIIDGPENAFHAVVSGGVLVLWWRQVTHRRIAQAAFAR